MVGLGTYKLTGSTCERFVQAALEIGYRHIDTAQIYDNQREIGRAIKGYDRSELYLTSKIWPGDQSKSRVPVALDQILEELQTDYLDLLLLHWPDRTIPFSESLQAMAKLQSAGKIRSLGVSNFTVRHLTEALQAGVPLVTNQIEFHPFLYQRELQDFCARAGLVITAHTPLARGEVVRNALLASIGKKYGKSAVQVALRWLIQRGCVLIPKTATIDRLHANADLFDFELLPDDLALIDGLNANRRTVNPSVADFHD